MISQSKREVFNKKILVNSTSAIKEIFFIVLGVLIAVYISHLDEDRKRMISAKEFIQDINYDLTKDTAIFGAEIRTINLTTEYQKHILNNDSMERFQTEEIQGIIGGGYHNIKLNNSSFARMRESDIFHLSNYETLFKRINTYYTFYGTYLTNRNEWETRMFDYSLNYLIYQDQMEISFGDSVKVIQNENIRRMNLLKMLNSVKGRNTLKLSLLREKTMKDTYERIFLSATKLLKLTDSILINKKTK